MLGGIAEEVPPNTSLRPSPDRRHRSVGLHSVRQRSTSLSTYDGAESTMLIIAFMRTGNNHICLAHHLPTIGQRQRAPLWEDTRTGPENLLSHSTGLGHVGLVMDGAPQKPRRKTNNYNFLVNTDTLRPDGGLGRMFRNIPRT